MKSKLLALAVAATFAVCANAAPNAKTGLEHTLMPKVTELGIKPASGLFVGSSYFYYNNAVGSHVKKFVLAGKDKFSQNTNTISRSRLHWHNMKAYLWKKYDVVMMLYTTQHAFRDNAAEKDTAALKKFCAEIRAAGGVPMIMMPWACAGSYEKTVQIADHAIRDANANNIMVAPSGLAFAKCIKQYPEIDLIQKDKNHPTPAGTVLQAAVMYATMFKRSPEGYPYVPIGVGTEVDDATVAKLEKVAWETTKAFFGWK